VFVDGKHAFPWPILDWFYTADRLKRGGLMVLDDVHLRPVRILVDFMRVDPRWSFQRAFANQTIVFRKEQDSVHDVAFHMQPYSFPLPTRRERARKFLRRVARKVKKTLRA
jgi:hypothetical protein